MKRRETARYWRMPEYDNLECLHATYYSHSFAPHFHEGYAIGVITRGAEAFDYRGEHHVAPANQIVVVNPGEIHTGSAWDEHGWTYRMTYPSTRLMKQIAYEMTGKIWDVPFFRESVIPDADIARNFWALHLALADDEMQLTRDTLLREAFGKLIERYADNGLHVSSSSKPAAVVQARHVLEARYNENLSLDEVASEVGLSPYHFSRIFKRETGLPPHKYLTQLRIDHARLLLSSGMAIVDVAAATGFADQSHMTKWFKRVVGVSPGQYRRIS